MISIFLLAAGSYYYIINYLLIHELDEELENYKEKIEQYAATAAGLPEKGVMEDLQVFYKKVSAASLNVRYTLVDRMDTDENKMESFRELIYTQKAGSQFYEVTIAKPLEGTRLLIKTIVYTTALILLIIIATSFLLNRIVLRKLWSPFYDSITGLKNFKLGKTGPPKFPVTPIDEFAFMNEQLSHTIERAEHDYKVLKEFTENASHEMQTPLAIIRSKLDLLSQEEAISEKQTELLGSAYGAVKRLTRLNQSLLLLTKIENHQFTSTDEIELKTEIENKLQQFKEFWSNNQIEVATSLSTSHIIANTSLIDILLNNLLSNAGRHNTDPGTVNIKLSPGNLEISNTGNPRELDHKRLFNRFYKETSNVYHNGLGLSIVKQICEQSGITITYHFSEQKHIFKLNWTAVSSSKTE
jgi:signal transduction histidine kinase